MPGRIDGKRVAVEVVVWVFTLFLAMVFIRAGWDKFSDTSGWARAFVHWGYPTWFRILIGVLEVAAVLLLLVPRTAVIGGLLIIAVMLGGMATHLVHGEARHVTSEILPIILSSIIILVRRRRRAHPALATSNS